MTKHADPDDHPIIEAIAERCGTYDGSHNDFKRAVIEGIQELQAQRFAADFRYQSIRGRLERTEENYLEAARIADVYRGLLMRLREWDQMRPPMTPDHAAWLAAINRVLYDKKEGG